MHVESATAVIISFATPDNPRAYEIGYYLIDYIWSDILNSCRVSTYVVLTDMNVERLYLKVHRAAFQRAQESKSEGASFTARFLSLAITSGKGSKSRATKSKIEDWLMENECTYDTCIVCLRGGIICDLGAFVASTFLHGIPLFQVPTTLLAMADASIGGKRWLIHRMESASSVSSGGRVEFTQTSQC